MNIVLCTAVTTVKLNVFNSYLYIKGAFGPLSHSYTLYMFLIIFDG